MKVTCCLAALVAVMVVLGCTMSVWAIVFSASGEPAGTQIPVPTDQIRMSMPEPSALGGAILSLKQPGPPRKYQSLASAVPGFALGKLKPTTNGRVTFQPIPTQWDAQVIPIPTQWDAKIIPVASSGR